MVCLSGSLTIPTLGQRQPKGNLTAQPQVQMQEECPPAGLSVLAKQGGQQLICNKSLASFEMFSASDKAQPSTRSPEQHGAVQWFLGSVAIVLVPA